MTISRVTNLPPTPVIEDQTDGASIKEHHPSQPAPPTPPEKDASGRLPNPKAARKNLLAKSERRESASGPRETVNAQPRENTGQVWNAGLVTACELVQALVQETRGAEESASRLLHEVQEIIGPLTTVTQAPTAADLVATAVDRLRASEPNADRLQKLEELKKDNEGFNALGFYTVMAVMSAAPGIAGSIKKGIKENKINEAWVQVNKQVLDFTSRIPPLLKNASPAYANSPQRMQLTAMAQTSMTVPFQYLQGQGKGMTFSLSYSMMKWSQIAHSKETQASQEKLEEALGHFLDAHIDQPE